MTDKILNDRYKIIEQIGSGGMAIIYKAIDLQTEQTVAVKVLRSELAEDPQIVKHFEQEASAAASLSHPNIVKMRDVGCDGNIHYIVMDLIEGITLKDFIDSNKPIDPYRAANIALEIAQGLQHAHAHGIIHRDIKPHNIILAMDDSVKITDFGIARIVSNATRTTQYGKDMVGTVYYTSPEQVRGYSVDPRTDIYSLGVVLYEMVTGSVPFDGETAVSIAMQHVTKEPESAKKQNKAVPPALDNIIKNAMAKNIENRYKNISEMIRDLKRYLYDSDANIMLARKLNKPVSPEQEKKEKEKQRKKEAAKNKRTSDLNALLLNILLVLVLSTVFVLLAFGIYNIGITIFQNNFVLSTVQTPTVVGRTAEEAKEILQNRQLIYREVSSRYSSTVPKGCVIEQTPAAGEVVNEDELVDVVISLGAFIIDIPDFTGMDIISAEYELRSNAYIEVGRYTYVESDEPADTIVRQSIEPGEFSLDGNSVTIYFDISLGPSDDMVEVRNFVGYSYSSLEQLAKIYGITIGNVRYEYSESISKGVVMRQSVDPETVVARGTAIDFWVSLGPRVMTEKKITVDLPAYLQNRDTVFVSIQYIQDNKFTVAFEGNVEVIDSKINITLTNSGTVTYYIYVNGTFIESRTIDFN